MYWYCTALPGILLYYNVFNCTTRYCSVLQGTAAEREDFSWNVKRVERGVWWWWVFLVGSIQCVTPGHFYFIFSLNLNVRFKA